MNLTHVQRYAFEPGLSNVTRLAGALAVPGDVVECHGVRQRITFEYGAYALVRHDA